MNIELTDKTINNAINNTNSTCILRDSILAGYGARIYSSGAVSYIIEPTVNGSTKRKVMANIQLFPHLKQELWQRIKFRN